MKQEKRECIIEALREKGHRLTSQRKFILDVILEDECCSCKEIHYKVIKKDPTIGIATVYRMVNTLEELGAIDRKNLYHVSIESLEEDICPQIVLVDEKQIIQLDKAEWYWMLLDSLKYRGYLKDECISIVIKKESRKK
ncbi:Fur family transcriptional regulator [Niameybacter massiliensis]|uniref:Fur family transcriptional regulator n=1 Tax=Niameybacter massiliensis TaxID=1658108 RepID=UPI0006B4DD72|nr:transcriptional repressor [Niameybacter massiliensis]